MAPLADTVLPTSLLEALVDNFHLRFFVSVCEKVFEQGIRSYSFRGKLHYTDTGYTDMLYNTTNGHHQRTSSQQFCN